MHFVLSVNLNSWMEAWGYTSLLISQCSLLFSLRSQLRCCGVYNYTSWFGSVYYPSNGIPASCCLNSSDCNPEDLRNATAAPSKVYHQVCYIILF